MDSPPFIPTCRPTEAKLLTLDSQLFGQLTDINDINQCSFTAPQQPARRKFLTSRNFPP